MRATTSTNPTPEHPLRRAERAYPKGTGEIAIAAVVVSVMLLALTLAACGGSSAAKPASTATAQQEDPLDAFRLLLDALNAHDAPGVYARLSDEARKDLAQPKVAALVQKLASADPNFRITIDKTGDRTVNGAQAQLNLTLDIFYQGKHFPLSDVAFMALDGGQWKLSDHFLQTALAAGGAGPPPAKPRVYRPGGCVEGDVLAGVYLPSWLNVLEPCVSVEGIVREVEQPDESESDGDLSFNVEVSGADLRLLNDANRENMHGWLHMEIVPQDRTSLPVPVAGQHIRVQGAWVTDTVHGHNEIHPVWSLTLLP